MKLFSLWSSSYIILLAGTCLSDSIPDTSHLRSLGYTILRGEQSGEYSGTRYAVCSDVIIPEDEQILLLPGARVHFLPGQSIIVRGELLCLGTSRKPILLSSIPDSVAGEPKPEPWGGIALAGSASLEMRYCTIENSFHGIQAASDYRGLELDCK